MKTEFINDSDDMEWLLTVHLPLVDRVFLKGSAFVTGNEDCPEKILLYRHKNPNRYATALVYEYSPELEKFVHTNVV